MNTAPPTAGRTRRLAAPLAAVVLAGLVAGCDPATSVTPTAGASSSSDTVATTTVSSGVSVDSGAVLGVLDSLAVKGRAPATGYSRDQFGQAWADVDHNGCDTRNDILGRDLTDKTYKPGTHDCVVTTGVLHDPYTGTTIDFTRGQDTSVAVQIDHVVALLNAWQTGAQQLTTDQRLALANDPENLLAVDGPTNQQKGAGDAATWLPPNKAFRCAYVARQVQVKAKYDLWVTPAEKDAITNQLNSCAD